MDEIARAVANAIGDGCVVRLLDERRELLHAIAVDHRDEARRALIAASADASPRRVRDGWAATVVVDGRPLRLNPPAAREGSRLDGCGHPLPHEVAGLMVVPLRWRGEVVGIVAALRDRGGAPYSLREQTLLESLVGRATRRALAKGVTSPGAGVTAAAPGALTGPDPLDATTLAEQLMRRSHAAVWATDPAGRTLAVTPALSELVALPASRLIGLPMGDFVDPLPLSLAGQVPDEPERGDRQLLRADGVRLWVATTSTPLVDAAGRRRGTLTTVAEVTERKRVEVALRLRLDAARQLTRLLAGVLRGDEPARLLACAADAAADVLGVRRSGVFELRRDGGLLLRAGHGWRPGLVGRQRVATLGTPAAVALTGSSPIVVRDAEHAAFALDANVRSGCWIGIGDGRGVLAVLHDAPRDFDRDELDFLSSLAEALSGCIGVAASGVTRLTVADAAGG
ncbi:GAF domain-containing protein [Conexibacter stalactiti]|uniref:GAF domain-containing protein n=1 Tax=Conexibacter stalactiti TaxID=1940611 RepID=A0ABU4HLN0_9ACTN|nr:GAF domain-containing protein [Conexibacter stalactiti]MDW5593632.1 GAF domain-containing protein [Conexibacter stalactiti]MEC5034273.1 GAF domain-containing protein [Conexibacter stalactiti]